MAAQQQERRMPRPRVFRARKDALEMYDDSELMKRYRFDRAGILFVTDMVREVIRSPTQRNKALTPEMKVVLTLRYLATGKMQQCNGDDFGLSQPTISRAITQTLNGLASPNIVMQYIRFPTYPREVKKNQAGFMQKAQFPGVVGVVDGTHIRIIAPKEYEAEYINRKNFHSLNVQLVFDDKYKIIDLVAQWPGSTHDARILHESGLKQLFERHIVPAGCHILGDCGYPSKRWLLTPYVRPQAGPQTAYNR